MEILFLIITLALMLLGLAGTIFPVLPGIPIIYAGYLIYGLATDWREYGAGVMIAFGAVTLLVLVLDWLAGAIGAKKYGASRAGVVGSVIGAVLGLIFFNIIGLVLGPFVGALLGELLLGRSLKEAVRSGWGALLGFLAGSFFKIVTASVMIVAFLLLIIT